METHVVRKNLLPARAPDSPMRWAISKSTGEPVFIGNLLPEQNGNACDCKCPACNEDLQAVNADKDASHFRKENTRWKFFRHPSGHQRTGCSFLTAKLAALYLLMESDEIDLPAPRKRGVVQGISGAIYSHEAEGQRWRGKIVDKVWMDSQSAKIKLEDGKTVLVCLQTSTELSSIEGLNGVMTIQVDDPEVASWRPEQIMAALQLDNKMACWDSHWDDSKLATEAEQAARNEAGDFLDTLPPELAHLLDLSPLQKFESVLHAKVKEILAKAGGMMAPECEQVVERLMDDGSRRNKVARYPSQRLEFGKVRLETALGNMVPDVVCTARSTRNTTDTFSLLIEVAVTHKVDAQKLEKIVAKGLACIEIDLTRLGHGQKTIKVDQLREAVLGTTAGKSWVFNPRLEEIAKTYADDMAIENQRMRDLREREEERTSWLQNKSTESLFDMWLPTLRQYWVGSDSVEIEDGYRVWPGEIEDILSSRGFAGAGDDTLVRTGGLIQSLDEIQQADAGVQLSILWRVESSPYMRMYVTLILMATRVYPARLTSEEEQKLAGIRRRVNVSLKALNKEFARPTRYDPLIARLFPGMAEALKHPFGTLDDVESKQLDNKKEERVPNKETERVWMEDSRKKVAEKQRPGHEYWDEIAQIHERRDKAYKAVARYLRRWGPGNADTLEKLLELPSVSRIAKKYERSGLNVNKLLSEAWAARNGGIAPNHWFDSMVIQDTSKATLIIEALKTAGML